MRTICIALFVFSMVACGSSVSIHAQEDPLAEVKVFPMYGNSARAKRAIDSIDWQLGIKQELARRLEIQKVDLLARVDDNRIVLSKLTQELPEEVRFVDDNVRSQLVGRAMSELLNVKLDLATRESSLVELQKLMEQEKNSKQAKLQAQQGKMEIDGAMLKVQLAESQYQKTRKLVEQRALSEYDQSLAEYELALAKQKLESAVLKVEVEVDSQNAEVAQQLTAARVEIAPIKARLAAIEQFLNTFRDSAQITRRIAEIQRESESHSQNMRDLDSAMFRIKQEVEELSVLKSRIENDLKSSTPPAKEEE